MKLKSLIEQMRVSIVSDIMPKCFNLAVTKCKEKAVLTYHYITQPFWTLEERGRLGVELFQTKLIYNVSLHPQNFCCLLVPHLMPYHCHDRQTTNMHRWWYVTCNVICVHVSIQLYVCAHRLIRKSSVCCVTSSHSAWQTVDVCHGGNPPPLASTAFDQWHSLWHGYEPLSCDEGEYRRDHGLIVTL